MLEARHVVWNAELFASLCARFRNISVLSDDGPMASFLERLLALFPHSRPQTVGALVIVQSKSMFEVVGIARPRTMRVSMQAARPSWVGCGASLLFTSPDSSRMGDSLVAPVMLKRTCPSSSLLLHAYHFSIESAPPLFHQISLTPPCTSEHRFGARSTAKHETAGGKQP